MFSKSLMFEHLYIYYNDDLNLYTFIYIMVLHYIVFNVFTVFYASHQIFAQTFLHRFLYVLCIILLQDDDVNTMFNSNDQNESNDTKLYEKINNNCKCILSVYFY